VKKNVQLCGALANGMITDVELLPILYVKSQYMVTKILWAGYLGGIP